ncbi:hypothetical protein C7S18_03815 [Ahniella affigens]|uniref:Glycosyltransferase subfamily 4-like N-terminal domain-containing protein n=1 Tax=Ahniella affigens TaxID=2021234 RepID=A0A2P1PNE2_9GAMM|nr:glycosyltransferase family 4 protein [Ahniella affigens]AVP96370.1 hypothetical protein C7S18_03815 [Ahniella affigens]
MDYLMRVLFVTHRFPGGAYRGDQMRALAQIKALSKQHDIHVLCYERPPADDPAWAQLRPFCASLTALARPRWRMLWQAGVALFGARPLQVAMFDSKRLNEAAERLITAHRIELMHVQLVRLAGVLDVPRSVPVVLDFVDALSRNMASRSEQEPWYRRWLFQLEARRLLAIERDALAKSDGAVISAAADAREIAQSGSLAIAANGVDIDTFLLAPTATRRDGLIFHGNWAYFPNQHGLRWLLDQVMPTIWATHPDLSLKLAGANSEAIPSWARRPGVQILGRVPCVATVLKQAQVAVAPLQTGSGQSLKILESMAAGTPTVTTSRAGSAVDAEPGRDFLVADSAQAFAQHILDLLANPVRSQELASAGCRRIGERYAWARSHDILATVWDRARRHAKG